MEITRRRGFNKISVELHLFLNHIYGDQNGCLQNNTEQNQLYHPEKILTH